MAAVSALVLAGGASAIAQPMPTTQGVPPSLPTSASPSSSPAWRQALAEWLAAHRVYPEEARRGGKEGTATVRFTVEPSGRVTAVAVVQTSGSASLDAAAESLLRGAVLPPFDPSMPHVPITATVQIRYTLESSEGRQAQSAGEWYYCDPAHAYYPYVTTCPVPWREVAPYQYGQSQSQATAPPKAQPAASARAAPVPVPASPATSQPPPASRQGLADRQAWESWQAGLTGDYRAGAEWWAAHRSVPHQGSCDTSPPSTGPDWTAGCATAQQKLAAPDVRRKTEPEYRLGWNSFVPGQAPTVPANAGRGATKERTVASHEDHQDAGPDAPITHVAKAANLLKQVQIDLSASGREAALAYGAMTEIRFESRLYLGCSAGTDQSCLDTTAGAVMGLNDPTAKDAWAILEDAEYLRELSTWNPARKDLANARAAVDVLRGDLERTESGVTGAARTASVCVALLAEAGGKSMRILGGTLQDEMATLQIGLHGALAAVTVPGMSAAKSLLDAANLADLAEQEIDAVDMSMSLPTGHALVSVVGGPDCAIPAR